MADSSISAPMTPIKAGARKGEPSGAIALSSSSRATPVSALFLKTDIASELAKHGGKVVS